MYVAMYIVCMYAYWYQILMQDEKAFPRAIPGSFQGLNHFFIPKVGVAHQVFLCSNMILKCDTINVPVAADQNAHYYLRSQSSSVDPEVSIDTKLAIDATKKDASSKKFLSEQHKAWDSIKSDSRKQEELAKIQEVEDRQRRQQKAQEQLNLEDTSGIDVTLLDEEKQKKLYEEAQLKNRKQNIGQTGGDHHAYGSQGNFTQAGGNNTQLDAAPGGNFGWQQSQHYAKPHEHGYLVGTATVSSHHEYQNNPNWRNPMANQSNTVENYNVSATRPAFQEQRPPAQPPISHQNNPDWRNPMVVQSNAAENYNVSATRPAFQEQRPPAQPPISQYPSQVYSSQGYQPSVSQPQLRNPAQQMAHIPRAGVGENTTPVYVSSGGTQHSNYDDNQGHPHQRSRVYHNYEEIPGQPNQSDHLNQQNQYSDPVDYPANYNPNNFEVGSMYSMVVLHVMV